jgi:tRNA-2-methylthio-N6-dimethylallyladenosine synthase
VSAATTPARSASCPRCAARRRIAVPGDILAEIEALVAEGVCEVTLLGQNVNAYGVEFGDRQAFSKLLRACGEIEGLERVRFTSPHPADFTDDVIEAMAQTPNVMPQLHMPLQSGSDRGAQGDAAVVPAGPNSWASSIGSAP